MGPPSRQGSASRQASSGPEAGRAVDLVGFYLAQGIRDIVYTLSPERIVVGGGVSKLPGFFESIDTHLTYQLGGYPGHEEHGAGFVVAPGLGGSVRSRRCPGPGRERARPERWGRHISRSVPATPISSIFRGPMRSGSGSSDRLVDMPAGVHRHPVVFVAYDEGVYAIKELPRRPAAAEFAVLRSLEERTGLAATPVGLVSRDWVDRGAEQGGAVITRYVEHSFPYRHLVSGPGFGRRRGQLLDAIAGLLVDLHLAGCFWGDCSLSNVLYRYDAGAIEAIMIDAETSELHSELSDGQRLQDLEIMRENLAGEMADIAAEHGIELEEADLGLGDGCYGEIRRALGGAQRGPGDLGERALPHPEADRPSQRVGVLGGRRRSGAGW